jgi:hypothetical protein
MKAEINHLDALPQAATAWFGRWLAWAEIVVLAVSALFAALVTRGDQSMDALSYFEFSEFIHIHNWAALVNGYWTPGYAFLLSFGRSIANAGIEREWPIARITNLFIFAFFVACAYFLVRTLTPAASNSPLAPADANVRLSRISVWIFALAMVIELSIGAYDVTRINPDILVGALFLLVAAYLVKLGQHPRLWYYAAIGLLCGIGYLAKAVFFPLTLILIVCLCFFGAQRKKAISGAILTAVIFAAIGGPYILALSRSKGHFSYSDAGHLNYIWLVDGFPRPPLLPVESGAVDTQQLGLKHPVRILRTDPFIASFDKPVAGLYPPWIDASYWLDGVKVPFRPLNFFIRALVNVKNLFAIPGSFPFSTGCLVALVFAGWQTTPWRDSIRRYWPAFLLSISTFAIYMAIEVDIRYVATAALLFFLLVLSTLRFSADSLARLSIPMLLLALFIGATLRHATTMLPDLVDAARRGALTSSLSRNPSWLNPDVERANAFRDLNLAAPGSDIACLGTNDCDDYWMRLTNLRVISQAVYPLGQIHRFWQLDPKVQQDILDQLASTGAKVAVSSSDLNAPLPEGWFRLANSNVVVRRIEPRP